MTQKEKPPCIHCQGTGFVQREGSEIATKCPCRVSQELRSFLPSVFKACPVSRTAFPYEIFSQDTITWNPNIKIFGSFINTYLTHAYLRNPKFTYRLVTFTTVAEVFYEPESNELYSCELLILLVHGGYKNTRTEQCLYALLKDRELHGRMTHVYVDSADYTASNLPSYLGDTVFKLISKFKKVV